MFFFVPFSCFKQLHILILRESFFLYQRSASDVFAVFWEIEIKHTLQDQPIDKT